MSTLRTTLAAGLGLTALLTIAGCPQPSAQLALDTLETDPAGIVETADQPAADAGQVNGDTVDNTPEPERQPEPQPEPTPAPTPDPIVTAPADETPVAPNPDAQTDFVPGVYTGTLEARVNVYVNNEWVDSLFEDEAIELEIDADGLPIFDDGTQLVQGSTTEVDGLALTVSTFDIKPTAISVSQFGTLDDPRITSGDYSGTTTIEYLADGTVHYSNVFSIIAEYPNGGIQRQDWFINGDLLRQ